MVKYCEIFGGEGSAIIGGPIEGDWEIIGLGYLPVGPKRGVHLVDHVADRAIRADFVPDIPSIGRYSDQLPVFIKH